MGKAPTLDQLRAELQTSDRGNEHSRHSAGVDREVDPLV